MINPPEYVDGRFELYKVKTDTTTDYPRKYIETMGMKVWFRELSVFDRTRNEFDGSGREITSKIRIPMYKEINSECVCVIEGVQHSVYNATHVKDKDGFPETELTLIKPPEGVYKVK